MKHLFILIGLFLIIVGASECNAPKPKAQLTPADQIFYGQERDTGAVTAQALRVVPGTSWIKWGLNDGDSITMNGVALMSQNSVNSQERIVTDTAFREWISSWVSDSVTITGYPDSSAVYDSLAAHLVLILANSGDITTNGDSITAHRSEINTILDSIAAHRIDIDAGGGGSFNSFYFNNGSTVTEISDGDTLTHVASGGSGVSTSGSISTAVQNMIDTFGVAAVYSRSDGTITRSNTTLDTTLHQYYIGFSSPTITYYGAQTLEVSALFSYVVGKTYYLQDNGRLDVTADSTYDSAVLNVIANPSGNNYIVNLADPRHFLR